MHPVLVRILHRTVGEDAGPLEAGLASARLRLARSQAEAFRAAGASATVLEGGEAGFGPGLRRAIAEARAADAGLVVLGSGSIPLATDSDLRRFAAAAADSDGSVLTNNRYSGDVVAIPRPAQIPAIPDLPGDNALPRWLEECAAREVTDLRGTWRLQVDVDGPLDLLLLEAAGRLPDALASNAKGEPPLEWLPVSPIPDRLAAVRAILADRRAEVMVAGRASTETLRWFEAATACRTRLMVEERGLRASTDLALSPAGTQSGSAAPRRLRPPRSLLGLLLDRDGPEALGPILAELGDAALIDSRVLLAHRLGTDERRWPPPEDRYASDLLLPERIADPWLRALTAAAVDAQIPVLLGGHSLVGPGLRLVASGAKRTTGRRAT